MLTPEEEQFAKDNYIEYDKWKQARDLDKLELSQNEYNVELKKIYGDDFNELP